jgi:hypothetical protein
VPAATWASKRDRRAVVDGHDQALVPVVVQPQHEKGFVTPADFGIDVGLRARELVAHVPPDARTRTSAADVSLEREGARIGLRRTWSPPGAIATSSS